MADDEVDYTLWDESHPLGTDYYGSAIEGMPVLEACPDETQTMRYKLITLPKTTTKMPLLTIGFASIQLGKQGDEVVIQPKTRYYEGDAYGYTAILHNSNYADLQVKEQTNQSVVAVVPSFLGDTELNQSIVKVGKSFTLISKDVSPYTTTYVQTSITIIGNDTGVTRTVPVTIYTDRIFAGGSTAT